MKIMLDLNPQVIADLSVKYDYDFWQLRTPLTAKKLGARLPYALDNGCFSRFQEGIWNRLVDEAHERRPIFVTAPDIVGDAQRTVELFHIYKRNLFELPIALVLQDHIQHVTIPWDEIDAVFVGGSDSFKTCQYAMNACRVAKMLGKWVHVGRVNSPQRVYYWHGIADSIDGSGLSRFEETLAPVVDAVKNKQPLQDALL